ncbi:MAG: RDD family protein [Flavobacteriaceae bacterium]|nr:RDD family protein [Flavobacteriaceae bacterium]
MRLLLLRFFAFYIDSLVFSIITVLIFVLHHLFLGDLVETFEDFRSFDLLIYYFVSYLCYFIFSEYYFSTTLGKKIFGFRIEANKNKNFFIKIVIRTFLRVIPINPISYFFNEEKKCWHEIFSKTFTKYIRRRS